VALAYGIGLLEPEHAHDLNHSHGSHDSHVDDPHAGHNH
jgi:hypothetical protein